MPKDAFRTIRPSSFFPRTTAAAAAAGVGVILLLAISSPGVGVGAFSSLCAPASHSRLSRFGSSRRGSPRRASNLKEDSSSSPPPSPSEELCLVGVNVVNECEAPTSAAIDDPTNTNTQSKLSAATNLGKCICGAGSFALPHVFLEEGVLGGALAMTACAYLAAGTMRSLARSRASIGAAANYDGLRDRPPASYVALADAALGPAAAKVVFALTVAASLGVCSTYIAFVGQTLASLSADAGSQNIVRTFAPDVSESNWEGLTALVVYPLSLVRNYGVFAFTSALGVTAVLGGILVTLAYGASVDPGGGIILALSHAVTDTKLWPESLADAFGGSFGTIAYLFCINFLTFPIVNSMKDPNKDYREAVNIAVSAVWAVNIAFAILCLGFYGSETQDLVLANLDNGPYLSALKLLLCVDLLFTFPIVFSSGRQILEGAILAEDRSAGAGGGGDGYSGAAVDGDDNENWSLSVSRAAVTAGAVGTCYGLSQLGGFGVVANLVGGVAQGTLAFIMPPAIAISLIRRKSGGEFDPTSETPEWLVGAFGVLVVSSVTYFTFSAAIN